MRGSAGEALEEDEQYAEGGAEGGGRLWLHFAFGAAYAVLLLRLLPFLVAVPGGWLLQATKVTADIFTGHFSFWSAMLEDDPLMVVPEIIVSFVAYGAMHYAVASRLPEDEGDSRMLKFMYFCRSLLYLFVTLLVLLVIARMFLLIYRDLSFARGGGVRVISVPSK
jgi:hypothetical protein